MDKILIPCDFFFFFESALRLALDIVRSSGAEIHLLHVIELPIVHDELVAPIQTFDEPLLKELRERAEANFESLKQQFNTERNIVKTIVEFGPTISIIKSYLEEEGTAMVVMGTKGASGLQEVLIGSTAEKVVRHATCPVVVVKKYSPLSELNHIVFPNSMEEGQEDLIMHVKALQHLLQASLHVVWIETSKTSDDTIMKEKLENFAKRFLLQNYTLNVIHADNKVGIVNLPTGSRKYDRHGDACT